MNPRSRPRTLALLTVVALALGVVGCGGVVGARGQGGGLVVEDATIDWPANPTVAAVRMVVRNDLARADALVRVQTPIAESVEVHRSEIDPEGRAVMVAQPRLDIAPRSEVTFEPSGLHVMLTGITEDLQVDDEVELTFTFEEAGDVEVTATVVAPGSVGGDQMEHDHGTG